MDWVVLLTGMALSGDGAVTGAKSDNKTKKASAMNSFSHGYLGFHANRKADGYVPMSAKRAAVEMGVLAVGFGGILVGCLVWLV